jgi:hypothetical protein
MTELPENIKLLAGAEALAETVITLRARIGTDLTIKICLENLVAGAWAERRSKEWLQRVIGEAWDELQAIRTACPGEFKQNAPRN